MKILLAHNRYQQIGGEDSVVKNEIRLLQNHGHEVYLYEVSNDSITSTWDKVKVSFNLKYSKVSKSSILEAIDFFKPDIVHVHNIFPLITPSVFDACNLKNIPSVHTLHNFRHLCPTATLFKNGQLYLKSLDKGPLFSIMDRPYRNSYFGSLMLAKSIQYHHQHHTWKSNVNGFIALTDFAKNLFSINGFPREKIYIKPNFSFSSNQSCSSQNKSKNYALYLGRLSDEKGVRQLVHNWHSINQTLLVAGDGPLLEELSKHRSKYITFLGSVDQGHANQLIKNARFLIVPSIWYEGFPMVVAEAFSQGTPVLASSIGALKEIIRPNINGMLFSTHCPNDMLNKIKLLFVDDELIDKLSMGAKLCYQKTYSPQQNYQILMDIYKKVLNKL